MGVLIAIIVIGCLVGAICFAESVQEKRRIKSLNDRDEKIWGDLYNKYKKIPENEWYYIYQELDWVCKSLDDYNYERLHQDEVTKCILSGVYYQSYPFNTAKQKLQVINKKYGWTGSDAVEFSMETSSKSVYENRYFLANAFCKNGNPGCRFHFKMN